ncbi:MAG TPA: HAD family phosphatase [Candidatus Butyricimonas faecavium]|nr:HAD family phosphatase [Candidatus Butyricimonas faecavium]
MKNIIFDLGGVVVEWNAKKVLETFNGNPILVNFVKENRLFLNDWRAYDRGDVTRQELIDKVALLSGCPTKDCNEFIEHVKHSLAPIPETETLIKELSARGFKLYCLSNMSVDFYDYLKTREVFKYFDGQIISALEHMVKPDREIYNLLLNRYHLKPEESLFIDDLEPNVKAAQAVGINTLHFTNKHKGCEEIRERLKEKKQRTTI